MPLRWGIVTAGKICNDFVNAVNSYPDKGDQVIAAVAARDPSKANNFAKLHNIGKVFQSYQAMAVSNDIDVAYIGALNPDHYNLTKLFLENGKHVLCEKPLCLNSKQVSSLLDLAKKKKLFLMEAVWSRFAPAYLELEKEINAGKLGDIGFVEVNLGVPISQVARVGHKALGGSAMLDLGIYVLQFAQFIFKEQPVKVTSTGVLNDDGVDQIVTVLLEYSGARRAVLNVHTVLKLNNRATVYGSKGSVSVSIRKALGGSAMLDLGIYVLQFAQFIFKQQPVKVTSTGVLNDDGVDQIVTVLLEYSGARRAVLNVHTVLKLNNRATVYGSKGSVSVSIHKALGGSAMLDLGIYVLQFAQFIFKQQPVKVTSTGVLNDDGVDQIVTVLLEYSGARRAVLNVHTVLKLNNRATVYGSKGSVSLAAPFNFPTELTRVDGSVATFPLHQSNKHYNFGNSAGLVYEAVEVNKCLKQGLLESPRIPLNESLLLAKLQDTIRKQLGVHFDEDDLEFP